MKASLRTFLKSLKKIKQENIKSIIVAFWNTVIPFSITVHIEYFVLNFLTYSMPGDKVSLNMAASYTR